jgi:hypothetical protein
MARLCELTKRSVGVNFSEMKLKTQIKKLRLLAETMDPFATLDKKHIKLLKELEIPHDSDPFQLTNLLLKRLEDALEQQMLEELSTQAPSPSNRSSNHDRIT